MASSLYNAENIAAAGIPDARGMRIGIAVSEWNSNITDDLLEGAVNTLKQHGINETDIIVRHVPGSFELIYASAQLAKSHLVDAVIAIGCVIRGDTPHFDYISSGVTQGIAAINQQSDVPVVFGVLTTNNLQQAEERSGSGGIIGNKGDEFAITAIKMVDFSCSLKKI